MIELPPQLDDASAWYGPELSRSEEWIETISESEIAEVESMRVSAWS